MTRVPRHLSPVVAAAPFCVIVDADRVIRAVPVDRPAAEARLRVLESLFGDGRKGAERTFRIVEVDAETYRSAMMRRIWSLHMEGVHPRG